MSQQQTLSVQLFGSAPDPFDGKMLLEKWTKAEARARARQKIFKIVKFLPCALIGLVVHPLLILIAIALFVFMIGVTPAYMMWSDELVTCIDVDGTCPSCKKTGKLRPYIGTKFKTPMTVQCPACGQTSKAVSSEEPAALSD